MARLRDDRWREHGWMRAGRSTSRAATGVQAVAIPPQAIQWLSGAHKGEKKYTLQQEKRIVSNFISVYNANPIQ